MSRPASLTRPPVGRSRPLKIIKRVVLPEPEGPMIEAVIPAGIERSTPRRILTFPASLSNSRDMFSSSMAGPVTVMRIILFRLYSIAIFLLLCGVFWAGSARAEPLTLLVLGDSLTAGLGLPPQEAFSARLEKRLKEDDYDIRVVNGGVSGDTTSGGRARLDWMLEDRPDFVILEFGGNDMLRGIDPAVARENLDAMLAELGRRDIPVLLAGMKAFANLGLEYGNAFAAIYPKLATKHGVLLYPFFMEGILPGSDLLQDDGLHPSAAGVDRIVEGIYPDVIRLIRSGKD